MVRITINPTYEIRIDEMNYTVFKNSVAKSGKNKGAKTQTVLGYYPSIKYSLESIARDMVNSKDVELQSLEQYKVLLEETLNEYMKELETVTERVEKVVKEKKGKKVIKG
jgi:hypothetical protein